MPSVPYAHCNFQPRWQLLHEMTLFRVTLCSNQTRDFDAMELTSEILIGCKVSHLTGLLYMHIPVHVGVCMYMYLTHTQCSHTRTHARTHARTHTHTHTHTHANTHAHTHTHTHTHRGEWGCGGWVGEA